MASVQVSGAGSGLDVNSLVTQLVAAERAPAQQRLTRAESGLDAKISALGTLRGALSTFQGAAGALRSESQLLVRKTEASDPTVLRASATASAASGSYSVEVLSLATAHKLASQAYAGGSAATVGSGTLDFQQNGGSFSVTVTAGTTLAQLRDAINGATGNAGVRASVVQTDDGARLVLTAKSSGSAQAIRITSSDAAGGLQALVHDPGVSTPMTVLSPAANAQAKVEGFTVSAAGNTITGAIEGVTIDLLAAKPGTAVNLTVSADNTVLRERIGKMVTEFNNMTATLSRLRAVDPATRNGGPLVGDSALLSIESRMRRDLAAAVTVTGDAPATLSAIGVRMGADGRLSVDDAKLTAALRDDPAEVVRVFAGEGGIAERLHTTLNGAVAAGGQVAARTESLQAQKRDIQRAKDTLDMRMKALEARYRLQFTNLDSMLSGLQSTGNYLARTLR